MDKTERVRQKNMRGDTEKWNQTVIPDKTIHTQTDTHTDTNTHNVVDSLFQLFGTVANLVSH